MLKPSGVRIGTAEIYAQMEDLAEIADSLAVGQNTLEDQRVILFVKLADGFELTDQLKDKIRKTLRENASPRHVPARNSGNARYPLYIEYEEGGKRGHEYTQWS